MRARSTTGRAVPASRSPLRAAVVLGAPALLALVAAGLGTVAGAAAARLRLPGPGTVDDAVVAAAGTLGAVLAGWLAVGTIVSVIGLLADRDLPRILPSSLHRIVAVALGLALLGAALPAGAATPGPAATSGPATSGPATSGPATSGPATSGPLTSSTPAATSGPARAPAATALGADPLAPGWTATRPLTSGADPAPELAPELAAELAPGGWTPSEQPPPVRTAVPGDPLVLGALRADAAEDGSVTVRRGDTLWDIAARSLGEDATDADIAAAWPRWFRANSAVVGPDPDLLLPGQVLVAPPDQP